MFAPRARIQHLLRDHKYALLGGNGFCAVAGEGELNRRWEDLGMRCRVFYLLENDWDMEDIIWLHIDIETKNWHFKFNFINIADNII